MRYRAVWFRWPTVLGPFMSMPSELRCGGGIVEVRQGDTWQAPTDLAFDVGQRSLLFRRHQHPGVAFGPGTGSAADAVDIIFRHVRDIVTDDVGDVDHVETTGSDVGCHQNLEVSPTKPFHGPVSLRLREIAVQLAHGEATTGDDFHKALGRAARAREHADRRHV